jgi:hypothetical protein
LSEEKFGQSPNGVFACSGSRRLLRRRTSYFIFKTSVIATSFLENPAGYFAEIDIASYNYF